MKTAARPEHASPRARSNVRTAARPAQAAAQATVRPALRAVSEDPDRRRAVQPGTAGAADPVRSGIGLPQPAPAVPRTPQAPLPAAMDRPPLAAVPDRARPVTQAAPRDRAAPRPGGKAPDTAAPTDAAQDAAQGAPPGDGSGPAVAPLEPAAAEPVAAVAPLPLTGTSDQAALAYLSASPSAMAATQAGLSSALAAKLTDEQGQAAANTPPLRAAAAGGAVPMALPAPVPAVAAMPVAAAAAAPADHVADPLPEPAAARTNSAQDQALAQAPSGSVFDLFKSWIGGIIDRIATTDPGVSTKAGAAGRVALQGNADPVRAEADAATAGTAAAQTQAAQEAAFRAHPGQHRVQPAVIETAAPVRLTPKPQTVPQAAPDPDMAAYAQAPLPADVRDAADAILGPGIQNRLAPTRAGLAGAAARRDQDRAARIAVAQAQAQGTVAAADRTQRQRVLADRRRIADQQGQGIAEARSQLSTLRRDTAARGQTARGEVATLTQREEVRADTTLRSAETRAEGERQRGEAEAAQLKAGLAAKKSSGGLWNRVKSAISSAVRAITRAIDGVFTRVRKAVAGILNAARRVAVGILNAARRAVTGVLDRFRSWAKAAVSAYLSRIAPALARRVNAAIDKIADAAIGAVNAVVRAAIKGVEALARGLAKALDKGLSIFQTALTTGVQIAGALLQGDFKGALRAAVTGACRIAGVEPKPVFQLLDRAGKAIGAILKNPVGFARNLFSAVAQGVRRFLTNIGKHLMAGVIGWLTGALSEIGLQGPFSFTPKGIGMLALQVLGVTYANIRARVIKRFPAAERVIGAVERGMGLVRTLITKGPIALWDRIVKTVGNLKAIVLGAIGKFISITVIKEGIVWLLSMLNPAAALVKVVKAIFDLVTTVIARLDQIRSFAQTIWSAVSAVLAQNFKAVVTRVESTLARALPVLISLLAGILGLGGISARVAGILRRVTAPVNRVIDAVVTRIVGFARKLVGKAKAGAKKVKAVARKAVAKVKAFLWPTKKFRAGTQTHTLLFQTQSGKSTLFVRSTPQALRGFLKDFRRKRLEWLERKQPTLARLPEMRRALGEAERMMPQIDRLAAGIDANQKSLNRLNADMRRTRSASTADRKAMEQLETELQWDRQAMLHLQDMLAARMAILMPEDNYGQVAPQEHLALYAERYKLEGVVSTFQNMPRPKADHLEGDHQPSQKTHDVIKSLGVYATQSPARFAARESGNWGGGFAINLDKRRHMAGRTHSGKAQTAARAFEARLQPRLAAATTDTERRGAVANTVQEEIRLDIRAMRAVYRRPHTDPVWSHLRLGTSLDRTRRRQKEQLVAQIRNQVLKGLAVLEAQPVTDFL
ncbi:MAG: hypothetical protein KDA50_12295 [Rhodobacteraceae bacterium]|nr:hypothetical protein [Paracoccaceae bacterium]